MELNYHSGGNVIQINVLPAEFQDAEDVVLTLWTWRQQLMEDSVNHVVERCMDQEHNYVKGDNQYRELRIT